MNFGRDDATEDSTRDEGASQPSRRARRAAAFPKFRSTAGDQLSERRANATLHVRLRQAYTPSQPVTDRRLFAGRMAILSSLIRALEDERLHVVIYGERGIGKTSSMHVVAQAARDARYLVPYVSCGPSSTFDETFRVIAAEIPLLFHSLYGPTSPEGERGATLAELLPPSPISVRVASELLAKVTGTRVLVFLDEFDRVEAQQFRRHVAEFIKNLSDRSARVQFVIAGVADDLTDLIENIPSIQRALFALDLPRMSDEETTELVRNGEEVSGLRFDEAAVKLIVRIARGLPYIASLISHHAGLRAIDGGRTNVTSTDASEACRDAVTEFRNRVSKKSQATIDQAVRDGSIDKLATLLQLSQTQSGSFGIGELSTATASANGVVDKLTVERLADDGFLVATTRDGELRYRFREESVQPYIWLLLALLRLADSPPADRRKLEPSSFISQRAASNTD